MLNERPLLASAQVSVGEERETPLYSAMPWLRHSNFRLDPAQGDRLAAAKDDGVRPATVNVTRLAAFFDGLVARHDAGLVASF